MSQFTAKAWVNFDGTGTIAIRDSHNVSSLSDQGTGYYHINYSNNLGAADYAVTANAQGYSNYCTTREENTTYFRLNVNNSTSSAALVDDGRIKAIVFGD